MRNRIDPISVPSDFPRDSNIPMSACSMTLQNYSKISDDSGSVPCTFSNVDYLLNVDTSFQVTTPTGRFLQLTHLIEKCKFLIYIGHKINLEQFIILLYMLIYIY